MFGYSKLVWSLSNTTEFQDKVSVTVKFLDTINELVTEGVGCPTAIGNCRNRETKSIAKVK
jgi:hypothetical protein